MVFLARRAAWWLPLLLMLLGGSGAALAGDVRLLPDKLFEVSLTDDAGGIQEQFPPGGNVVVNVRFGLMHSEVKNYPVVVTITIGKPNQAPEAVESFNGRLEEGLYVLTEKFKVKANWSPEAPYKVTVKTRMINRTSAGSESYYSYYTAEGTLKTGYR